MYIHGGRSAYSHHSYAQAFTSSSIVDECIDDHGEDLEDVHVDR